LALLGLGWLQVAGEGVEPGFPEALERVDPAGHPVERFGLQVVDTLASSRLDADDPGVGEYFQVLDT
jgi:hypothetical protein